MDKENQNNNNSNEKGFLKDFDLEKIRKENPFVVPPDYFEDLPGIINEKRETFKVGKLRHTTVSLYKVRPAYYIAAILIVMIATTMFLFKSQLFTNNKSALAELSWDEVVDDNYYVYSELDVYNLIETIVYSDEYNIYGTSDDINDSDDINTTENDSSLSSDEIIEYLVDENIDTDEFYEL